TPVTFYATLAADQIAYVAGDCDARIAVLDGAAELARWQPILDRLPGVKQIIVRDPAACPAGDQYLTWDAFAALGRERFAADPGGVTAPIAAIRPEDPVTLLYTSGTTGNPKGVLLTHHNVLYEVAVTIANGTAGTRERLVSYLPLAHIAERMLTIYMPIATASHVHFCPVAAELIGVVGAAKPTSFFGVPRVWEKVRAGIQALLTMEQDEGKRAEVARAMDTGRRYVESRQFGHSAPPGLDEEFARADRAVLGRSARCSASARRRRSSARRPRCRRT
ncbi:MAG TPA: AMP-binding protein, partial [Streptosporangiaceae bacterium]|nr:AMP-binding protein [Streptosporangiaceae bacterium]